MAPSLDDLAAGRALAPQDPDLIYFLGASCLARIGSERSEDGIVAAKALEALSAASMEVAVWTLDAAMRQSDKAAAARAFEDHIRGSGSRMLVDVLRLGRFTRAEASAP
jgi:hypothetical protein